MKRIKELRLKRNWSQSRLGREAEIASTQISNWERGAGKPSADNLGKLADALGCSTDYLLERVAP